MSETSADKATPRPWSHRPPGSLSDSLIFGAVRTPGNIAVAEVHARDDNEERQANIELIVRAVNSYDAYRRCLDAILGLHKQEPGAFGDSVCAECKRPWPCEEAQLILAVLEAK